MFPSCQSFALFAKTLGAEVSTVSSLQSKVVAPVVDAMHDVTHEITQRLERASHKAERASLKASTSTRDSARMTATCPISDTRGMGDVVLSRSGWTTSRMASDAKAAPKGFVARLLGRASSSPQATLPGAGSSVLRRHSAPHDAVQLDELDDSVRLETPRAPPPPKLSESSRSLPRHRSTLYETLDEECGAQAEASQGRRDPGGAEHERLRDEPAAEPPIRPDKEVEATATDAFLEAGEPDYYGDRASL